MDLTLTDLTIIIELVEKEMNDLAQVMNNSENEQLAEDSAICLVQVGNVAGKLKFHYEKLWSPDCNYQSYENLIKSVEK